MIPAARTSRPGEVFLVLGLLALIGVVITTENVTKTVSGSGRRLGYRGYYDKRSGCRALAVPANARITIRGVHGDITVRSARRTGNSRERQEERQELEREGRAAHWRERRGRDRTRTETATKCIPRAGGDSRVSVDMDVVVPKKSSVTVRSDKGDISVSDMATPVTINGGNGDVEVRNTTGDVSVDVRRGDVKVSGTKGDVKISGSGDSVEVVDATGNFTVNGEFVGPIRAEKIAKGVRFVSHRTDFTLTQLSGHMEAGSGNLEVVDAPGNLNVRTHEEEITIENAGGQNQSGQPQRERRAAILVSAEGRH